MFRPPRSTVIIDAGAYDKDGNTDKVEVRDHKQYTGEKQAIRAAMEKHECMCGVLSSWELCLRCLSYACGAIPAVLPMVQLGHSEIGAHRADAHRAESCALTTHPC